MPYPVSMMQTKWVYVDIRTYLCIDDSFFNMYMSYCNYGYSLYEGNKL